MQRGVSNVALTKGQGINCTIMQSDISNASDKAVTKPEKKKKTASTRTARVNGKTVVHLPESAHSFHSGQISNIPPPPGERCAIKHLFINYTSSMPRRDGANYMAMPCLQRYP